MSHRSSILRPLAVAAAILACAPAPALAAWPHHANLNLLMCAAPDDQREPKVISDGAGGAIIVWLDRRNGFDYDVYAQRVSASGTLLWTPDGVALCTAAGQQYYPDVVSDGAGGAIVTWQDFRAGGADLYAQRVDASGAVLWITDGVAVCTAAGNQNPPQIESDGSSGAVIAWHDPRSGPDDIYAQRVNSAGLVQWTAGGVAVCTATSSQFSPELIPDGTGGAIVTWYDYRGSSGDIYAQRVNGAGVAQWTANGVALCAASGNQTYPVIIPDDAGGAIVVWNDNRNGNLDVYAQRVTGAGAGQWTSNGVALCAASGDQYYPKIVRDGEGGGIATWTDYRNGSDIYAQRVSALGAPQWTTNGVVVCAASGGQSDPQLVADGIGGAVVVWYDGRGADVYAQHVSAAGSAQWTADGVAVCTAPNAQYEPMIAPDGASGAVIAWYDNRSWSTLDIYAQRIERFGYLGNPEPAIVAVRDVPNDQGGFVQVEWTASYLDAFPGFTVAEYSVWRRAPNGPGAVAPRTVPATGVARIGGSSLVTSVEGGQAVYWEYIATLPARGLPGYSFVAPTTSDSLPGSNPRTSFLVMAEEAGGIPFWASDPDSGYSVDNLAPPAPAPFTGLYASGTAFLSWGPSPVSDFALFRLHRGGTPDFAPDAGNLVVSQADTGYVDAAGAPYYYKLAAVDVHGNVGVYALCLPGGAVDVPGAARPDALALDGPAPNPMREGCVLHFALPRAARVSLEIFDQRGRRLRQLVAGDRPAGSHAVAWNGRDEGGRVVPSGIYFARLEVEGRVLTRRVAAIR